MYIQDIIIIYFSNASPKSFRKLRHVWGVSLWLQMKQYNYDITLAVVAVTTAQPETHDCVY
jgi:NAD-dependent oxidoreductase involved in siderophore biosynthesis